MQWISLSLTAHKNWKLKRKLLEQQTRPCSNIHCSIHDADMQVTQQPLSNWDFKHKNNDPCFCQHFDSSLQGNLNELRMSLSAVGTSVHTRVLLEGPITGRATPDAAFTTVIQISVCYTDWISTTFLLNFPTIVAHPVTHPPLWSAVLLNSDRYIL